jgi:hypothetical protein
MGVSDILRDQLLLFDVFGVLYVHCACYLESCVTRKVFRQASAKDAIRKPS